MTKTLGQIVTISKGKKHSIAETISDKSSRYIQIEDLRNDLNLKYTDDQKGVSVTPKDVLIAWDGANAGTIGYNISGKIGSTIARLRLKENVQIDPIFLGRFLESKFEYLRKTATGATIPHISRKALEKIEIPNIALIDQKRIAQVLSDCEDLIAKRKESIVLLDDLVKSTFLERFGDPVRNEKNWSIIPMDDAVLNIVSGTSYSGELKTSLGEDEFGVLKISAVTSGVFNPKEFKAVKKKVITKKLVHIKKGMFLISRANTKELVAASCIVDKNYSNLFLPDKLWSLTINKNKIHPIFFNFLLKNDSYRNKIRRQATGGHDSMLNISMKKFKALDLICPDFNSQLYFSEIVTKTDEIKEMYYLSLIELEHLYNGLSQDAFKGELDLNKVEVHIAQFPSEISFDGNEVKVSVEKSPEKNINKKKLAQFIMSSFGKNDFSVETLESLISKKYEKQSKEELKLMLKKLLELKKIEQTYNQEKKQITFRLVNEA